MKRIKLNERYSIHKYKNGELWYLEYYRFGEDYMPDEIYADKSILKILRKYEEIKGV